MYSLFQNTHDLILFYRLKMNTYVTQLHLMLHMLRNNFEDNRLRNNYRNLI